MPVSRVADAASITFGQLLRERAINPAFQPIVRIDDGEVVGFEALARGPAGSAWGSPEALFAEAYRAGKAAELDRVCRLAAARSFAAAGMPESIALFVNVEPMTFGSSSPSDLVEPLTDALAGHRRVILEITERSVTSVPAQMLRAVEHARRSSLGVAVDDVGVDPASLAMMPLIRPDVIKLDLTVVQQRRTRARARTVNAVLAEAERTGAAILAEGIETDQHLHAAQAMGATLGQGWYFGRPEHSPAPPPAPRHPIDLLPAVDVGEPSTPFGAVRRRRVSQGTERLLTPLSRHLEYRGLDAMDPTVLLACFQDVDRFGEATRERYEQLAAHGVFTAILGRNMPAEPGHGIRGAQLEPADPINDEWAVIALGAQFAAALVAKERGNERGVFDFVVTNDRDEVIAAARPVIKRIVANES
jgi:EAL domain-containing protein (putative c-di-GMP-specific phosphodiesterase class I)